MAVFRLHQFLKITTATTFIIVFISITKQTHKLQNLEEAELCLRILLILFF